MTRSVPLFFTLLVVLLLAPASAQQAARPPAPYRILISNDDGVRAPGLAALAQALKALGDVIIVAPSDVQSGKSHAVVTIDPVFREDLTLPGGLKAIGLGTTPATAMFIALANIVKPKPDLIVTGINRGYNLGYSVYRSGTAAGAREGAMHGIPSMAASMAEAGDPRDWPSAAQQVLAVARQLKAHPLPVNTFLNVNVPPAQAGGYKGVQVTSQAMMLGGSETFAEMTHPSGRTIYWSVYREGVNAPEGTDIWAVEHGYVSITPMRVGEYDNQLASTISGWFR
jgi:5'-nucleotidase